MCHRPTHEKGRSCDRPLMLKLPEGGNQKLWRTPTAKELKSAA